MNFSRTLCREEVICVEAGNVSIIFVIYLALKGNNCMPQIAQELAG